MYSKKNFKNQSKPTPNPTNILKPQNKLIDLKNNGPSRNPSKQSNRSHHDPQTFITKVDKKKQQTQSKLKTDLKLKNQGNIQIFKQTTANSNSSDSNQKSISITSLERQKRIQLHKERNVNVLSKMKQKNEPGKNLITKDSFIIKTGSKQSIIPIHNNNIKLQPKQGEKKLSKNKKKSIQNNKSITGYLTKKDPIQLSDTVSLNSSQGSRKSQRLKNSKQNLKIDANQNKVNKISHHPNKSKPQLTKNIKQTKIFNNQQEKSSNSNNSSVSLGKGKGNKKIGKQIIKQHQKYVFSDNNKDNLIKINKKQISKQKIVSKSPSKSQTSNSNCSSTKKVAKKTSKKQNKPRTILLQNNFDSRSNNLLKPSINQISKSKPQHVQKIAQTKNIVEKVTKQKRSKSPKNKKQKSPNIVTSISKSIKVPKYSIVQLTKIQNRLQKINSEQQNENMINSYIDSIIYLMSWIWQAEIQSKQKIDSDKCLRKLLQFHNKTQLSLYYKQIDLKNVEFQTDLSIDFNEINNLQKKQKMQVQDSGNQFGNETQKRFVIYDLCKRWKQQNNEQGKTLLIILLLQIMIYNYSSIVLLDKEIVHRAISTFKYMVIEKKLKNILGEMEHHMLQQLAIYTFSELNGIRIHSNAFAFRAKKNNQDILWKFFFDTVKIQQNKLKNKQFINFRLIEAFELQTAYVLACEFTHYMKKFSSKIGQINIIQVEEFLLVLSQRIIQFNVYLLQLADRQKKSAQIDIDRNRLYDFKFQLLLYDWAVLTIKCDQRKTFQNLIKSCKRQFLKHLEKKKTARYSIYQKKQYVNDNYARFTIQEVEDEDAQFFEHQRFHQEVNKEDQQPSGFKISLDKVKTYISIPYMNFLVFQDFVPISMKRKSLVHNCKIQNEQIDSHLMYLLILSNRQYLLRLIQQIECIDASLLSPKVGKGLVKLCTYCHEFKSVIICQKYLKLLGSHTIHKQLLQKLFDKDIDFQRRLSQSMNQNITGRFVNPFDNEDQNQNQNNQRKSIQKKNADNSFKVKVTSCELMYFEIIMEIEKAICYINLEHFMQQVLKKPDIFRAQIFFSKLLQNQHISVARQYLFQIIIHYIEQELRSFDMMAYFEIFSHHCMKIQSFQQMAKLVALLPIKKLIKFHNFLLSESFSDQPNYRVQIPDGISKDQHIRTLTSAGYEYKMKFIDKHFQNIHQILMWRAYLRPIMVFDKIEKYIYTKAYFTIIFELYSIQQNSPKNHENIKFLIDKLKTEIQKAKIDVVCSSFHFLSLALMPKQNSSNKNNTLSKNTEKQRKAFFGSKNFQNTQNQQKFTEQLFYLIRECSKDIIDMFKNKQSATMKCLGDQMRKRTVIQVDNQVDQMKRKQIAKMLSKMKNMHDYLIRIVIRFIENTNYSHSFLRNFDAPEQFLIKIQQICRCSHLQKNQRTYQAIKQYYTPKLNLNLSSVSSNNIFETNLRKDLKIYQQSPTEISNIYGLLVTLRCITQKWIEQKLPSSKQNPQEINRNKNSKSSKIPEQFINKSKQKPSRQTIASLVSVEKIFEICINSVNHPFSSAITSRDCQLLKQKFMALETLGMLHFFITNKYEILKFLTPLVVKTYKMKFHCQLSNCLINLLMNKQQMLGKQERDLIMIIRLKALDILIKNYKSKQPYNEYEWRFVSDSTQFWFIINSLTFDRSVQIRCFIIKSLLSRYSDNQPLSISKPEVLTLATLMASQQPNKSLAQLARKIFSETLSDGFVTNHPKFLNVINTFFLRHFLFLVNFNTMYKLQKNQKKFNQKQFFMVLVDAIFQKKQMDSNLFSIMIFFKNICNENEGKDISKIFKQLKWNYNFNVQFYPMSRAYNYKGINYKKDTQQNQIYQQLIKDLKQDQKKNIEEKTILTQSKRLDILYNKKYPHSTQIFIANIKQSLKMLQQAFLQRCSKANRKALKSKKLMSISFKNKNNSIFAESARNRQSLIIKPQNLASQRMKKDNDFEFDI